MKSQRRHLCRRPVVVFTKWGDIVSQGDLSSLQECDSCLASVQPEKWTESFKSSTVYINQTREVTKVTKTSTNQLSCCLSDLPVLPESPSLCKRGVDWWISATSLSDLWGCSATSPNPTAQFWWRMRTSCFRLMKQYGRRLGHADVSRGMNESFVGLKLDFICQTAGCGCYMEGRPLSEPLVYLLFIASVCHHHTDNIGSLASCRMLCHDNSLSCWFGIKSLFSFLCPSLLDTSICAASCNSSFPLVHVCHHSRLGTELSSLNLNYWISVKIKWRNIDNGPFFFFWKPFYN